MNLLDRVQPLVEKYGVAQWRAMEAVAFAAGSERELATQGLFDPGHYSATTKINGPPEALLLHYLLVGWKRSATPFPGFNARAFHEQFPYCQNNDLSPLEVYIKFGRFRGQAIRRDGDYEAVASALPDISWPPVTADVALVLHAFYLEEFQQIWTAIARSLPECDVFVTTVHPVERIAQASGGKQAAGVFRFPNHGRDVYPFVHLINHGLLKRYSTIGKLHTKRSGHRTDGNTWLDQSIASIVNPKAIELLTSDSTLGMLVPAGKLGSNEYLEASWWLLSTLTMRAGWTLTRNEVRFPMGTMFWARREVLQPLTVLNLSYRDFEVESGQLDGTLAHVMERFFGVACLKAGFRITER